MPTVAMSGSDTLLINDRLLTDFADANVGELTYPNDIANVKTGKNSNSIYGLNETGRNADMKIRLLRGSGDDKYMNGQLAQMLANFAGFILVNGLFVKKIGDGKGAITNDSYVLSGGIFLKNVEGKSNVEGDTEQSVAIYMLRFALAPRAIGQ